MSEFFQPVSPDPTPDTVTPHDGPGDPAGWAKVTPEGAGTAPYDIAAPQPIGDYSGALDAANSLSGAGVNMAPAMGPRQAATKAFLNSPAGTGAMDITAGFPDYEDTSLPGAKEILETPIQGEMGTYPVGNTAQAGLEQYHGPSHGLEGLTPESGSMDGPGAGYPGTEQSGLPMYGGKK